VAGTRVFPHVFILDQLAAFSHRRSVPPRQCFRRKSAFYAGDLFLCLSAERHALLKVYDTTAPISKSGMKRSPYGPIGARF